MNILKKIGAYFQNPEARPSCFGGAPIWYLEKPDIISEPGVSFEICGWIASSSKVKDFYISDDLLNKEFTFSRIARPDVEAAYHVPAQGFAASCSYDKVKDLPYFTINFRNDDGVFEILVPVKKQAASLQERKENKLKRLLPILCCPHCKKELASSSADLHCVTCSAAFPHSPKAYNFLTAELQEQFNIVSTSNVSANQYDGTALNLIHKHHNGLILDCGAGLRDKYYENVVNFEIAGYDSTDVLGVGERLPFKDSSFDCVFSFAVLEHVKDPFICAKEICRVLKPGGDLYCQVPFLQPVHGYPHHYYNMTQQGLKNLFEGYLGECEVGIMNFGQPIFFLSWALNSYCNALPASTREKFKQMKIGDLLQPGNAYMGADFVQRLSAEGQHELSCCNYLIATKV